MPLEGTPLRVVVVGDLSHRGRYHLGDEAMSEVALEQLQRRGVEVTFVAGDPLVCAEMYGVPAVPRFGFSRIGTRQAKISWLETIVSSVRGDVGIPDNISTTVRALQQADAVLVAGGGNLNSVGLHHIFERLALARVSRELGIPLYVSSQTVGPHLTQDDQPLVREIAEIARVFGVRERNSADLMRGICGQGVPVVRTLDDAVLLAPDASIDESRLRWNLPERYAVGSFTFHAKTTDLEVEDYYRRLAEILDRIWDSTGTEFVLLPHMGNLQDPAVVSSEDDAYGHARIAGYCRSAQVRSMPLLRAKEVLSITAGADFSISTRYHPLIFGPGLGVPSIGIVHSYYSAVRMRGALANSGMDSFAVPLEAWVPLLGDRIQKAMHERAEEFRAHLTDVGERQRAYQNLWWDWISSDLHGHGGAIPRDFPEEPSSDWTNEEDARLLALARLAQEGTNLSRLTRQVEAEQEKQRRAQAARNARALEETLQLLRRQNEVLQQELADIRHRLRPPGADFRDRLSARLRKLRERS